MAVQHALAVIPSSEMDRARTWWARVLGRQPDQVPMPSDLEWMFPGGGGLQVVDDAEHAGSGSVTLAVDDVDAELAEIAARELDVPQAQTVPSGQFRIAMLNDPDGNTVVIAQTLA